MVKNITPKMTGQKGLRTMKNGVNKIANQGEIWYKIIPNCQIIDIGEKLGQL